MGGDDSQKLLPWRGICSSPGRKPPAHYEINTVAENCAMGNLPTPPSPDKARPGRGSATGGLGHFWQAYLGHYSRAPKTWKVGLNQAGFPKVGKPEVRVNPSAAMV